MAKGDNKAEDVVFGKETKETPVVQQEGVSDRKIEVSESAMKDLLQRLSDLEADKQRQLKAEDDIFNPLKEVKDKHTLRMSFWGDELVLGYIPKVRPDGTEVYVINKVIEEGEFKGQMRGMVTLQLANGKTEEVDYIRFMNDLSAVVTEIKARRDIGKIVEQGEVNVMAWNGRALTPTSKRTMTGYKHQKFEFDVEYQGKPYTLTSDVINLK